MTDQHTPGPGDPTGPTPPPQREPAATVPGTAPETTGSGPQVTPTDPEAIGQRLEAIGADLPAPDEELAASAQARLAAAGLLPEHGRVAELAVWWAQVRGDVAAGPPHDVVLLVPEPAAGPHHRPVPDHQPLVDRVPLVDRLPAPDRVRTLALQPPAQPAEAVAWGIATADALADSGAELLLISAPDLMASRVLAALLMGLDPVEANGWPADYGLDDTTWMEQVAAVRDGLRAVRGLRGRPGDLLQALGSPVLAAATGLLLRSAARHTPALLDGPGAAAAALLAQRMSPYGRDWWQVGHLGEHPLHERCLASLRLQALTRLGMTVEDGTGALIGLAVLDLAAGLLPTSR